MLAGNKVIYEQSFKSNDYQILVYCNLKTSVRCTTWQSSVDQIATISLSTKVSTQSYM